MSTLNVDKVDPNTGTALEIGSSGDTVTVPSGATLTLTSATLNLPTTITSTTEVKTNKISPATGVAFALGDSGDTFTVPSGATIANSGTATGFGITQSSFRPNALPILNNGDMNINQRGTVTGITGDDNWTIDRWKIEQNCCTVTVSKDTDVPTGEGFGASMKIDVTSANASVDAADSFKLRTVLEGQNLQIIKQGTGNAQPMTYAFWVKSTTTGNFVAFLIDQDNGRSVSQLFAVDSADTWEKKIVAIPVNSSGVYGNDNGASLQVAIFLDAGSTQTSSPLQTAWGSNSDASRCTGITTGWTTDTANNFWITGIQLEVGTFTADDIPPFQFESYGENLFRCERYFTRIAGVNYSPYQAGVCVSTIAAYGLIQNPVRKRAVPSWSHSGTVEDFDVYTNASTGYPLTTFLFAYIYQQGCTTNLRVASGLNAGYAFNLIDGDLGDTYIDITAEI